MPEFVNPFSGMKPDRKITHQELLRALRLSLSAEEEATHLYEAIADACDNSFAAAVLKDIADEERVHKGEFQHLIELLAADEHALMRKGADEVDEIKRSLDSVPKINKNQAGKTIGNLKKHSIGENVL